MSPIPSYLNILDYLVFFGILAVTLISILYGRRAVRSARSDSYLQYILMGRKLSLPLFIATLVATWYGGIFGVTAIAYEKGIYNFVTQGVFWYVTYLIFAFFILDKFKKTEALTLPEIIGERFGARARRISAIFNLVNVLPISYTIGLGIFIQAISGLSLNMSMFLGITFVCAYSATSGFLSVVFTDVVQFFVMCSAVLMVLIFSVTTYGGLDYLQLQLPNHFFSITGDEGWASTLVWGLIALATLIDPNFYQRCLAARDVNTAKIGILASTIIWCLFDICTTFGAMYAQASMPGLKPNEAYLTYALNLLPNGLRGFFIAGILATILSTLDSYLFIASNTVQYDLRKSAYTKKGQIIAIFTVGISSIVLANFFEGNIKLVWKTIGSFFSGTLLVPVVLKYFKEDWLDETSFVLATFGSAGAIVLSHLVPFSFFGLPIDPIYVGMLLGTLIILLRWKFFNLQKSYQL